MEPKLTNVFRRNAEAFRKAINGTGPNLIINSGGQGSSKTYSILQVIEEGLRFYPEPLIATFCSYALPHLKAGVITPFDQILYSFGLVPSPPIKTSPQQPIYHLGKSEINCYGVEGNIAFAHGPRRDILYINECNRKISYDVFDQLQGRSKVVFIDFNPDSQFWLHEKVMPNFPHILIHSNFMDNPYLPESERQKILMKKDKPGFENWWKVYGLGELGTLEGSIFQNWRYGTDEEIQKAFQDNPSGYCLDYGFHPDPDAMAEVAIDKRKKIIYAHEHLYSTHNGTRELIEKIREFYKHPRLIIAESANPRTNLDLSKHFNIKPVNKIRTVSDWLREMQDYEFVISEKSFNLAKELQNYIWSDKKSGTPIDAFNHLIDAIRYWYMMQNRPNYF